MPYKEKSNSFDQISTKTLEMVSKQIQFHLKSLLF